MEKKISLIRLIHNFLLIDKDSRDDWMKIIHQVHFFEMMKKDIKKEEYFEEFFVNRSFSNVHTIKRLWQKVQEIDPSVRGKDWAKRQKQGGEFCIDSFSNQLSLYSESELNEISKINLK